MRVALKKRTSGQIEFGILYGGMGLLILGAARFLPVLSILPRCAFKGFTGIPCPTCGSTRSLALLAKGEVLDSLAMNPMVSLCFAAAGLYFFYCVTTLTFGISRIDVRLSDKEKNVVRIGFIVLVFLNWIYLLFTL